MHDERIHGIKKNIIAIGRLLWEKDLASGLNGNISARVDETRILMTGTKTCLGLLQEKDILLIDGDVGEQQQQTEQLSTETLLHTSVYKNFSETAAIIHTHTTYTNAFFLENKIFHPRIFESKMWFGDIAAIVQRTPSVTDVDPVMKAFKENNIIALHHHGVVAMGKDLFDCFLLIQILEEAIKVDALSRLYRVGSIKDTDVPEPHSDKVEPLKKYNLFSREQIEEIVRLANSDEQLKKLGAQTKMTMDLAVKMNETGQVYSFKFVNGAITQWGQNEDAEFLISAPETVWRAVFNRRIDPFVATTQKKMHLRGDFAKISKWYEPCCRIFELWQQVPVD